MLEIDGQKWGDHLLFRNALIKRPELAEEYASVKIELARRYPADREAYLEGKAPFIERVLVMLRGNE
jgi:GrpB-like predicted nucleotidyltransferase (UPF0157 family)